MTDKAAAVYAIVSVPCVITIPSYFPMLSLTVSAMRFWSDIVISLLSMFISVIGTISYFSQTCGISASIFTACSSLDCGASPLFVPAHENVPPVCIHNILFLISTLLKLFTAVIIHRHACLYKRFYTLTMCRFYPHNYAVCRRTVSENVLTRLGTP